MHIAFDSLPLTERQAISQSHLLSHPRGSGLPGGSQAKLREMARPEGKAKITKSLIVEVAIQLAIEELETSGEKSPLAGMLAWQ